MQMTITITKKQLIGGVILLACAYGIYRLANRSNKNSDAKDAVKVATPNMPGESVVIDTPSEQSPVASATGPSAQTAGFDAVKNTDVSNVEQEEAPQLEVPLCEAMKVMKSFEEGKLENKANMAKGWLAKNNFNVSMMEGKTNTFIINFATSNGWDGIPISG